LRRLGIICAVAVVGSAVVAYSVPRSMARPAAQVGAANAGTPRAGTNDRVVIATGFEPRSVAIRAGTPTHESADTAAYVTVADLPDRIFSLRTLNASAPATGTTANAFPALFAIAGIGTAGSLGDGGMASAAELNLKLDSFSMRSGVAVGADGTIFISDSRNSTIRRIAGPTSSEAGVIRSVAGRWAPRQTLGLVEPLGIALDRAGNLYIADRGSNSVLVLRAAGAREAGTLELLARVASPGSVAVAGDGSRIFVSSPENGTVFVIELRTHEIRTVAGFAGHASACAGSEASTRGQTQACPAGLAVDGGGNLFVADMVANHILRIDAQTSAVTIAAQDLSAPGEISFDGDGNLFVAEQGRRRLVEIRGLGVPVNSVTLSPLANDFGVEPTHGVSPTVPFTLTNGTNAPLTSLNVSTYQGANPGDFQTASTSCLATLPANSSCLINIALAPTDAGPLSAQLAVTYTGALNPVTAALTGTGANYTFDLAGSQPNTAVVTAGNMVTYNLQITPDNNFPANPPYTVTFVCPPIASPALTTLPAGDLQALTTCTFTPPSAPIMPGTVLPVSFVVMTTNPKTGVLGSVPAAWPASKPPGRWGPTLLFPALMMALAVALYWILGTVLGGREKTVRIAWIFVTFVVVAAFAAGCGGGGKKILGTPSGTANFLVQATVQNAQGTSLNVTRGLPLTLIVQ
jgi:DNA-binding beta-propeller fold protein YncE